MTDGLITKTRTLLAEATQGEWRACTWDPMESPHVIVVPAGNEPVVCARHELPRTKEDAALIAAAPRLLRELVDEVERKQKLFDGLLARHFLVVENRDEIIMELRAKLGEE